MADLTITASQVVPGTGAQFTDLVAAVAITAGQAVYKNTSNQAALADNDASSTTARAIGIATNGAAASQYVRVQYAGELTLGAGAAPTNGVVYVLSSTAGGIAPAADLASGDYTTILGVGIGSNKIKMNVFPSGGQTA